jgi:hypothetical protein
MAEINVENMEENAKLFEDKMGFAHNANGLDMTDDQLVNFLLLCHHGMMESDEEVMEEDVSEDEMVDGKVKVKVMKVDGGDMSGIMDEILGHGSPKIKSY